MNKLNRYFLQDLLLIHGDSDNNTGTFPLQSERLFSAMKGLGGTVRYVSLPFESHGYSAKKNIQITTPYLIIDNELSEKTQRTGCSDKTSEI